MVFVADNLTRLRRVIPVVLLFGTAGILHFVMPTFFERIVPPWVPDAKLAGQVSGAAEILGAAGLLWSRTRVLAAWALIALLVAVFPANVQMLQLARASAASNWSVAVLWARLPVQLLLLWWVWRTAIARHTAR